MTFVKSVSFNQSSEDELYVEWHGNFYRIDALEFIDTIEWDGDLVTMARGICRGATFEIAMKHVDYLYRLSKLEALGNRIRSLPMRMQVA